MPLRMAALAYPAFAAALYLSRPNAVADFERAGAVSPETARRPESLKVRRKHLNKAVKKKFLIAVGDGRYYVDQPLVRRSDRIKTTFMVILAILFLPLLWLMW